MKLNVNLLRKMLDNVELLSLKNSLGIFKNYKIQNK